MIFLRLSEYVGKCGHINIKIFSRVLELVPDKPDLLSKLF